MLVRSELGAGRIRCACTLTGSKCQRILPIHCTTGTWSVGTRREADTVDVCVAEGCCQFRPRANGRRQSADGDERSNKYQQMQPGDARRHRSLACSPCARANGVLFPTQNINHDRRAIAQGWIIYNPD